MWKLVLLLTVFLWITEAKKFSIKLRQKHHYPAAKNNKTLGPLMDVHGSKMHVPGYDIFYEGFISLGNPPKTLAVVMDTGSDMFWVPHVGCKNEGKFGERCGTDDVYNETKSETSVNTKQPFQIKYGIGSAVGTYYKDFFAFGDAKYPEKMLKLKEPIKFGAADKTVDGDWGVLGLSFAAREKRGTNIFGRAVREGLMDHPIFTVLYKKCPPFRDACEDGGMITFGEHDKNICGPIIGYVPLNPNTMKWEFMLDEISVGNYSYRVRTKVITDTGSSDFRLGPTVHRRIIAAMNAQPYGRSRFHKIPRTNKMDIKLKINGIRYTIPNSAITLELKYQTTSMLRILPLTNDNDHWNLGHPWVRSYCNIHYWNERKIGFAEPL